MELVIATLLGVAAVYRMSGDIVSPLIEGPFNLYNVMRSHVNTVGYPQWVKNGIWCKYCVSFWFGCAFALPFVLTSMISWWLLPLWAVGLSGPVVWYYDYMETLYPEPDEDDIPKPSISKGNN